MNKLKVYVYAIAKNESKFVESFVKSMSEADGIYVLDTGSSDDTVEKLKNLKVIVKEKHFDNFRFDRARNMSLDMVPDDADICVCADFDEIFTPGWRVKIEKAFLEENPTRIEYLYNWSFDEEGKPATSFYISKIHKRHAYVWHHPVHEVLKCLYNQEKSIIVPGIVLNHHQDLEKERKLYLPLLELSVKEDPTDDRNMFYLGREYMYYEKYEEAIKVLKNHLSLKSSTWKDERSASNRYIARCYKNINKKNEAINYYLQAIEEAPYLRDGYVELASLYYENKEFVNAYLYLNSAFEIKEKSTTYINEEFCWNYYIYDLYSNVAFNLGKNALALEFAKKASDLKPKDERIKENIKIMEEAIKKIT